MGAAHRRSRAIRTRSGTPAARSPTHPSTSPRRSTAGCGDRPRSTRRSTPSACASPPTSPSPVATTTCVSWSSCSAASVTVEWGDGGEEGRESFELGEFWVTDAGTPVQPDDGARRGRLRRVVVGAGRPARDVLARPRLDRALSRDDRMSVAGPEHDGVEYDVIVVGSGRGCSARTPPRREACARS